MLYRFWRASVIQTTSGKHDWNIDTVCVRKSINITKLIPKQCVVGFFIGWF